MEKKLKIHIITIIIAFSIFSMISYLAIKDPTILGFSIKTASTESQDLVLNLTFDDEANPWKDFSILNHEFTAEGNPTWANKSFCKWYGCGNFSDESIKSYLTSNIKFSLDNGIAVSFWVYHTKRPHADNTVDYYDIGLNDGSYKLTFQSGWGYNTIFQSENGEVSHATGTNSNANEWEHVFIQYNPTNGTLQTYLNGIIDGNSSEPNGNLNYTVGERIRIAIGRYDVDLPGYLDEFLIWNRSNFNSTEIYEMWNKKRMGTPPNLDIFVSNITYNIPYDYSDEKNRITTIGEDLQINFTIKNQGTSNSDSFNYKIYLEGEEICGDRISINSRESLKLNCNWPTEWGFHKGYIELDTSNELTEDGTDSIKNNKQSLYIPMMNRPWFHFNSTEWETSILPYAQNSENIIAYDSWHWYKNFVSDNFNNDWDGNDVDPRGKKGRENALSCLINGWVDPEGKDQCIRAKNHLLGWGNTTLESYSNVQSIHELFHVMLIYDYMQPTLTKEEDNLISKQYYDICAHITNLDNTRPDKDNDNEISGDNGWGFGSGMAGFCYGIIGAYQNNPTLMQEIDDQYWSPNIVDEWMDREISFLRAYKNDSWSKYQERWHYKFYSQYHLVENLWFEKRYGFEEFKEFQNAYCAMGREVITDFLDYNYNGNTLRLDENRMLRAIQSGDSNSYDDWGSDSAISHGILTYYALLCDDQDTKDSLLYIRNLTYHKDSERMSLMEIYTYKQLINQASPISPENNFPKIIFDNANDILTIRTNYTYQNDTVIQIDGGEERGSGHSSAQGYYLYALGEPFLDYEQVPYEDDVRAETWKNGISLQDTTQTAEGEGGTFSYECGTAPLNQYYGMSTCPTPTYSENYPDYRQFPIEYGGDIEDYVGTKDAGFAGAYLWRPYKNADQVEEYFIKFGDLLLKRTIVSNNQENEIYHNFINIYNEFSESWENNSITFTKDGKNLLIKATYTSEPLTIGGGESPVQYCFCKTSCEGGCRGEGKYRRSYFYTPSSELDMILAHHWYYDGEEQPITSIDETDKGIMQGNNTILFDINKNRQISYENKITNGWGLAYNDETLEIGAFNATYIVNGSFKLFEAENPTSIYIRRNEQEIILTANTMERDEFIDFPKTIRVTIDARELINNTDFIVKKEGQLIDSTTDQIKVSFNIKTGQNSNTYIIKGTQHIEVNLSQFDINISELNITEEINETENITEEINETDNSTEENPEEDELEEEQETSTASSGGGGGSSGRVTPSISETPKEYTMEKEEETFKIKKEDKINFSYKGEHTITINEITDEWINITIRSEPINLIIYTGEKKEIDIDNDGIKDITINLKNLKDEEGNLSLIQNINEIQEQPINKTTKPKIEEPKKIDSIVKEKEKNIESPAKIEDEKNKLSVIPITIILILSIIAIILSIYSFKIQKNNPKNKTKNKSTKKKRKKNKK